VKESDLPSGVASAVYELETRERRFHAVFESALDAIVIFDDKGRVLEANPAAAMLFGVSATELRGRLLDDFSPGSSGEQGGWTARRSAGARREFEIVRPDGERRLVDSSVTSDFVFGQHVGVMRDITDQRRQERERLRLAERLEIEQAMGIGLREAHELEAIGRLAGGIAHEFNNLLAVISGFAALLEGSVAGNPEGQDSIDEIKRATHRAVKLVHGLLAFSKREAFDLREVDLHGILHRSVPALQGLFGPQVDVQLHLNASRPWAWTDALQIEYALQQLAANAHDAMPDGGTFTIETTDDGSDIRIAVRDTGTGMDSMTLERAFDPFFTTKPLGVGTGLGLSTVYGIVARSGGRVAVDTEPGKGTTFHLMLRSCEPAEGVEADGCGQLEDGGEAKLVGTETVLLVERETRVAVLIESFLGRLGYRVIRAANRTEASRLADAQGARVDLLIGSLDGDETDSAGLLTDVRAHRAALPAILIGEAHPSDQVDTTAPSVWLPRPFAMADLAATARRLLDQA
jgi:PAS domain S-box-containing protein